MTEKEIVDGLRSNYGKEFTAPDVRGFCAANDIAYQTVTKKIEKYKVGRGKWNLEVTTKAVENIEKSFSAPAVEPTVQQNLVPDQDDAFVKFGPFNDIKSIIKSKQFYPTFITGLSGNGKTFGVEQACAQLGRELIRVNITIETDEDDLIGGFRLVDGATVWHNGPVVEALERGAVLLLDEIDLASNKILCLHNISLIKVYPLLCNPLLSIPITTSPGLISLPSIISLSSTIPVQNPDVSLIGSTIDERLGCSAVSPPNKEHLDNLHPTAIPSTNSFTNSP